MKNLLVSLATTALVLSACTSVVQPLNSSIEANQHLTKHQICAIEVRAYTDRFKNTREFTIGGVAGVGIAEATRKEDEYWKSSPLAIVPIITLIGYSIDEWNYNKAIRKCLESKALLEK